MLLLPVVGRLPMASWRRRLSGMNAARPTNKSEIQKKIINLKMHIKNIKIPKITKD
jgi:hypothetical protein